MPILEKLLHLKETTLHDRSFCGRRMVCSRDGFPQLQKLQFMGLLEWEEWIVEEGSMPFLHTLYIGHCPKLTELPGGMRSLKSLTFWFMGKGWQKKLSKGGKDYYKVEHIPFVQLNYYKVQHFPYMSQTAAEGDSQQLRTIRYYPGMNFSCQLLCIRINYTLIKTISLEYV